MENLKQMKKVSIIIPCRNEEKFIEECINSIIKQSYGFGNIEIIVCDGLSDDKTCQIVDKYCKKYSQIKLLKNEKKITPSGMNLGIRNSTGDIIILFGAHSYMSENYIELCVRNFENSDASCVGGTVINISDTDTSKAISYSMSSPFGVGNALFRYSTKKQFVDTVGFGAYKKEVYNKIGLFDEEFVRNQDDELNLRLAEAGGKILLDPEMVSYYYTRGSFKKLWRQYYQYGFWKVRVIQKHKRPASIRHLIPVTFVTGVILGGILSIFFKPILYIYLAVLLFYLAFSFIFAAKASKGEYKLVPKIILSFIILHISYGLGFLEGLNVFYITKNPEKLNKNKKISR